MIWAHLAAVHSPLPISPLSAEQAFEPARPPRVLADSVRSVRSAGLYALGATSVGYLVGARGAGTIRSHCRRCAHVARRRSSHLAPPVHWLPAPSHTAARGSQPMVGCCGLVERTLALQVVEARLCARRGLCTAWRQVSGRRALRWRRCRRWRRATMESISMRGPARPILYVSHSVCLPS